MVEFLRRNWKRFSKLGKGRKKKRTWRNPTGRHNKIREMMRGYPPTVKIGYKKKEKEKVKIVNNINELKKLEKNVKVIFGKVGMKKKIELAKIADERDIKVTNLNLKKFLKQKQGSENKK